MSSKTIDLVRLRQALKAEPSLQEIEAERPHDAYALVSAFGKQMQRVAMLAFRSEACSTCRGTGARELSLEELAEWKLRIFREDERYKHLLRQQFSAACTCLNCAGTGYISRWAPGTTVARFATTRCGHCKGTGRVLKGNAVARAGDMCSHCRGAGHAVKVTAHETGSSRKGRVWRENDEDDDAG